MSENPIRGCGRPWRRLAALLSLAVFHQYDSLARLASRAPEILRISCALISQGLLLNGALGLVAFITHGSSSSAKYTSTASSREATLSGQSQFPGDFRRGRR